PGDLSQVEIAPLAEQETTVEGFRMAPHAEVAVELGDHDGDLRGIEVEPDGGPDEAAQQRVHDVDPRRLHSPAASRRLEPIPEQVDPRVRRDAEAEAEPDPGEHLLL